MKTEEILERLERIEELDNWYEIEDFMSSLDLTPEQMELLADHENRRVRWGLAKNPNLPEEVMIRLSSDKDVRYEAFRKLKNLNSLKSKDLESAYDLIRESKHIGRENFEKTFDYISNKFPELSELAKMFKRIILKGKKDLK